VRAASNLRRLSNRDWIIQSPVSRDGGARAFDRLYKDDATGGTVMLSLLR